MRPDAPDLAHVLDLGRQCDTYLAAAGQPPASSPAPWKPPTEAEVQEARLAQIPDTRRTH